MARSNKHIWRLAILVTAGFSLVSAGESTQELRAKVTPVAVSLSGTLVPYSVALDGRPLFDEPHAISSLMVNGTLAPAKAQPHKPFFLRTDADVLELISTPEKDGPERIRKIVLPRLSDARMNASFVEIRFQGGNGRIMFDGNPIAQEKGLLRLKLPSATQTGWFSAAHSLEIVGVGSEPGRLYRLTFEQDKTVVLRTQRAVATAAAPTAPPAPPTWSLASFRLGTVEALQGTSRTSISADAVWSPQWHLARSFSLDGSFGVVVLRAVTREIFPALEYEVTGDLALNQVHLEAGGGAQTWLGHGGTAPIASGRVAWEWASEGVTGLYFGYSAFFLPSFFTSEFRIGIGVRY
jgi:hypothetical protein